jgi:NitT/TauT family transport system permease protein
VWPPVLVAVVFLTLWQLIVIQFNIKPYLLPAPTAIWAEFTRNLPAMWNAALYTGTNAFYGLVLGSIVAIVIALIAQRFAFIRNLTLPLVVGFAAVPIVALTPILNNMFNITSRTPRVLITMIVVFFPMFVNVIRGLVQVSPTQIELMRALSAKPFKILRVVRIPNAIPFMFTGLRIAAPLAVIAALVSEYFGGPQEGLGSRIASAAANSAYGRAWAYVVASIVTGLVFYFLALGLERLSARWTGRARSA